MRLLVEGKVVRSFRLAHDDLIEFRKRSPGRCAATQRVAKSPKAKAFESLANFGSATSYVLMEVARSVGTALQAAIATTIVVDHRSDCGAGGIRWNECKTLLRLTEWKAGSHLLEVLGAHFA